MRKFLFVFAAITSLLSCSDIDTPLFGGEQGENTETPEVTPLKMRTISMSASSGEKSRTTLKGYAVVWDENDEYCVKNEAQEVSNILQVIVDGPSQAMGIKVGKNDKEALIKYENISVNIGGRDVTNEILSPDNEVNNADDNDYKIGIQNIADGKRFPLPGSSINAPSRNKLEWFTRYYGISLVRASSTSNFSTSNKAIITMTGIEYSTNGGNSWTQVNANTSLYQGSKYSSDLKNAKYEWLGNLNWRLTLNDQPSRTNGIFTGTTVNVDTPNDKTRAVYPFDAFKEYSKGTMKIDIPEHQSYVKNSFDHKANIMIGNVTVVEEGEYEGKYDAHFTNAMGVLQLELTGDDYYLENITVTNRDGKSLWGTASIAAAEYTNGINVSQITGGSSTITLDCPGVKLTSEPTTFNIVVPVGAFAGGFDVTVNTADHRAKKIGTGRDNSIVLNDIKQMPRMEVAMADEPLYEFDIENAAVKKYMSYGRYSSFDNNTKSYFTTHSSELNSQYYDMDDPLYYTVDWADTGAASYSVSFRDDTAGKDVFANREVTTRSYGFMNMIPGHTYTYSVSDGSKVINSGTFKAVGQVRMVTISDSWNYRDIGGWPGLNGHKIRYGWLFRGGSLNGKWASGKTSKDTERNITNINNYNVLSSDCQNQLKDLGIRGELDLRAVKTNPGSTTDWPHVYSLGQHHTGFTTDWDFMQISSSTGLNNPTSDDAIVRDVKWLIDEVLSGKPIAYHCKSGADRTGGVTMVIEALLGVDPGDIARDYELTNFSKEMKVIEGKSQFRDRKIDDNSKEIWKFRNNGFPSFDSSKGTNWQEKAYYYLNQTFRNRGIYIPKSELDAFIKFMLNIDNYTAPSWAAE